MTQRIMWLAGVVISAGVSGYALAIGLPPFIIALPPLVVIAVALGVERCGLLITFILLVQGAIPFGVAQIGVNPSFLMAVLLALILLRDRRKSSRGTGIRIVFVFSALAGATLLISGLFHGTETAMGALSMFVYLAVFVFFALMYDRCPERMVVPVFWAALFHVLISLFELITRVSVLYANWKPIEATRVEAFTRVASTVADPNYFAVTMLVLGALLISYDSPLVHRNVRVLLGISCLGVVVLTFSRAGILGLVVSLVVYLVASRTTQLSRKINVLIGSAFGLATAALVRPDFAGALANRFAGISTADASVSQRTLIQELGLRLLLDNPVLGIGPGAFQNYSVLLQDPSRPFDLQTDVLNTYLLVGLAGGVFMLMLVVGLMALSLKAGFRRRPFAGSVLLGLVLVIATLDTWNLVPLWILLAALLVHPAARIDEAHGQTLFSRQGVDE